jgi:hypothetical protein
MSAKSKRGADDRDGPRKNGGREGDDDMEENDGLVFEDPFGDEFEDEDIVDDGEEEQEEGIDEGVMEAVEEDSKPSGASSRY